MKKITLFTVFMLIFNLGLLTAQTNKGKVFLGVSSTLSMFGTGSDLMSVGFSTISYKSDADGFTESDPSKMIGINFLPKAGYFFAENFVIGLDMNVALSTVKDGDDYLDYFETLFSAGPFMRYYIPTTKVLPFFEISAAFGTIKEKYDYDDNTFYEDQEYESGVMSFGGGIGLAAPLGERVTFDVLAGYSSLTIKAKEDNDDNERSIFGTLGFKIGIAVLLGSN